MFRAVSVQYEQAIGAAADVLGLELDEIRHSVETGTVDHDVEVACGTLPGGSVVGQIMSWSGYRAGVPVLVAEEYWTVTDIPGWDLDLEQTFLVRVIVDGVTAGTSRPDHRQRDGRRARGHVGRSARGRHDRGAGDPRRPGGAARRRRPAGVRCLSLAGRNGLTSHIRGECSAADQGRIPHRELRPQGPSRKCR